MQRIEDSQRLRNIEGKFGQDIQAILYKWHWEENLMHKEIGQKLNVPRPTITRWFKQFGIPSQSCDRLTKLNLLNVGPRKGPRAGPKPPKKPRFRIPVNENFFKTWSPEMAYVLGYFAADGNMSINPFGSEYVSFFSTDYDLLVKVREVMQSAHRISARRQDNPNWKTRYRLQIGSGKLFQDLIALELTPNKNKSLKFPEVPDEYLRHFVRGYFDGDGCVSFGCYPRKTRKSPSYIISTRFTSGSKGFLEGLFRALRKQTIVKGGFIYRNKGAFHLCFSIEDSFNLYKFMYNGVSKDQFLQRKYNIFQNASAHWWGRGVA